MTKVFITGVTGYIAGDAFYALHKAFPDLEYSLLVRTQDKADKITAQYPKARIVLASLDDSETLEKESSKADIVIHGADSSDNEGAAKAITKGLLAGHSKENPAYYIHTGGAGILTYFDTAADKLGESSDRTFNDWSQVSELTSLPDDAFHRNVDKIVLATDPKGEHGVHTAILSPPTIYGEGRGPVGQRGRQVYEMTKLILEKKYTPIIGKGLANWTDVNVHDLSDVYVKLVEKIVSGKAADPEVWGEKGYYLIQSGEHNWGELARKIAHKAASLGYIPKDPKDESLSKDAAMDVAGFEAVSWGLNCLSRSERAQKVLGWKPSAPSLDDEIETIIKSEKARL